MRNFLIVAFSFSIAVAFSSRGSDLLVSGDNAFGQLGNGLSDFYPEFISIAEGVSSVSAGAEHAVFEDAEGSLWLIGLNTVGSTEDALDLVFGTIHEAPVYLGNGVAYYEAWEYSNFFVFQGDSGLYTTGYPIRGVDGFEFQLKETPTLFDGVSHIVDTSSNHSATVYLDQSGDLYGFGSAFNLGLGLGSPDPAEPALLEQGILRVEMGLNYPTFIHQSGELRRYRFSGGYEVIDSDVSDFSLANTIFYIDGSGSLFSRSGGGQPKALIAENVKDVISEGATMFFLTNEDQLWGLGANASGLMGKGDFENAESAVFIRDNVKSMSMNEQTLYIIDQDGVLSGAGYNGSSRLGRPVAEATRSPRLLTSESISHIEAGYQNAFYVTTSGDLFGIGRNDVGQLGLGDRNPRKVVEFIASDVVDISVSEGNATDGSETHAVFVTESGDLFGMGSNFLTQISDVGDDFLLPELMDVDVSSARTDYYNVAYLKNDNSLWIRGYEVAGTQMVTDDAVKFDIGAVLFYLDSEGNLKTKDSGFISNYKNENSINDYIEELTIDTDVVELAAGYVNVAYIKEDGSLYISGSRAFMGEGYIVEPLLLDTSVHKISFTRSGLMHQKLDKSVWLIADSIDHYPPEITEIPEDPVRIWEEMAIIDFAFGETNILYLADSTKPPEIISISSSSSEPIQVGEQVKLDAEISGSFTEFTWYRGEVGDRSNPINLLSSVHATVYPYLSTQYWLEVSNTHGTSQSSEAVSVEVGFPEYGQWAISEGLIGDKGLYGEDPDSDGNANLLEFAYQMLAGSFDSLPISINASTDGSEAVFEVSKSSATGIAVSIEGKSGTHNDWVAIEQIDGLQVEESEELLRVRVPLETLEFLLLRLKVTLI